MSGGLRSAVVETAREMVRLGLVAGSSGNVSGRDGERIVITPTRLAYGRMTEGDLVTFGAGGDAGENQDERSSEWRVHAAIYSARPDAGAIVHTHSVHAAAWSFLGEPLDTGTEELEAAAGGAVVTGAHAPTGTAELADSTVAALGDRGAVLMARHGVVGLGATPAEALATCIVVERQAQVALLLRR